MDEWFQVAAVATAHRVPVGVWEKLLEQAEDELDRTSARQRLAHDDGHRLTRGDLDEAFRGAAEAAARKPA